MFAARKLIFDNRENYKQRVDFLYSVRYNDSVDFS